MQLETKHFGTLTIEEDKILTFPDGIPGFETTTRFVLIQNPDETIPFHWLQAVDDPALAFVVANPFLIRADYDIDLPQPVVDRLEIQSPDETEVYCILRVPEQVEEMTINLTAPLVINRRTRIGKQVVLDDERYTPRHPVKEALETTRRILEKTEKATDASPETPAEGGR